MIPISLMASYFGITDKIKMIFLWINMESAAISQTQYSIDYLDLLSKKKVPESEKLHILEQIDLSSMSDSFQLIHVVSLLKLTGKSPKMAAAADKLITKLVTDFNEYLLVLLLEQLCIGIEPGKATKVKVYTLNLIQKIADGRYGKIGTYFHNTIPQLIDPVSNMVVDISPECNDLAIKLFSTLYNKIGNKDILPLVQCLTEAMKNPSNIPDAIDKISSTTFVQSVDAATLSVIIPILLKCFRDAPTHVKRQTVIIIENMTKLVEDAYHALDFIEKLLPILETAKEQIADPEVRVTCQRVYDQLSTIKTKGTKEKSEQMERFSKLNSMCQKFHPLWAQQSQGYRTDKILLSNLMDYNQFTTANLEKFTRFTKSQIKELIGLYKQTSQAEVSLVDDDAEELCRCEFTLGYGSKVLLHKTMLHLHRGYCYGLIGCNNAGKSTLMKSMATRQLESFPQHLKSVYVQTEIIGDLSHLSLVDYIENVNENPLPKEEIQKHLVGFGFTEEMISACVSTLSGGWRMKLALSNAMMQHADILLMDEPSAHLDVRNIEWLLNYIKGLKDVTCIIVSQNAKLLDECCTHILQIDNLKLHMAKGNLSEFASTHPEALSYFELKSEKYTFTFPEPRYLPGVKSKGKPLMKMTDVTFTYPGNSAPTIKNATALVSMSSRIGCLGPNGAGKSTSIKLLTGQLEPDSGDVWTHNGLKIGYIAQHAFVHIEEHLDKTPNQYIQWRYECDGEDKEDLNKVTHIMSDEDMAKLNLEVVLEIDNVKVKRTIDKLTYGRRTVKKDREYEVAFKGLRLDANMWLSERDLIKRGFKKILAAIDIKQDAAEGNFQVPLTRDNIEDHLEKIGLSREHASHVKIKQLSNGEKVKVVMGAALWSRPQILILDEPTNNIDRDGLAALCEAIKGFGGGIIIITHDEQFCHSICKEIWVIEDGVLNIKGDPDWMKNAVLTTKVEEEMVDALGNVTKVKQEKKKLSRREKIQRKKRRARKIANGEPVSSSDDSDYE